MNNILKILIIASLATLLFSCENEYECYKPVDLSYVKGGEASFSANVPCYLEVGDAWGSAYIANERLED